ncbi:hypothetical protein pb186bvf_012088 [Paramecium bursaria]
MNNTPRFQPNTKRDDSWLEQKRFRMEQVRYFYQQKEGLNLKMLENNFINITLNSFILTYLFTKNLFYAAGASLYSISIMLGYGEQVEYHRAMKSDTIQTIFARTQWDQRFKKQDYKELNEQFIQKYLSD